MADILYWKGPDYITTAFGYNGSPTHFIHFNMCPELRNANLQVLVQDTSYDGWKTLGPIQSTINLPRVVFPPNAKIIVQGKNHLNKNISFTGYLKQGATYLLGTPNSGNHNMGSYIGMTNGYTCCPYNSSN